MSYKKHYLAAYDISHTKRLRAFLKLLRDYSGSGQKSVFECSLSRAEKDELTQRAEQLMDKQEDSFVLFLLNRQLPVITLGKASTAMTSDSTFISFL